MSGDSQIGLGNVRASNSYFTTPKAYTIDDAIKEISKENGIDLNGKSLIGTSFNTVGNKAGDIANKSIMDMLDAGASAEEIASAGKMATDAGLYDNDFVKTLGNDNAGLSDGMFSSIFGKDGYVADVNKSLEGVGGFSGLGKVAGLGLDVMGIVNQNKALKQSKNAWEAENARANEIMAMKREQYDTFKKDKSALNAGYSGETKVG